ncbi:MAG: two-component system sensor histidine kinase CreC [Candidatus Methylacidiphilales bacterium]
MTIRAGILLSYLIIAFTAVLLLADWLQDELRPRYLESIEESLVDTATWLAAIVSYQWPTGLASENGSPSADGLWAAWKSQLERHSLDAEIYGQSKDSVDMDFYLTDARGILLFDSRGRDQPGTDYSNWRDVHLTLKGRYGARSSKDDPAFPGESILYVAAPVRVNGELVGVLTVIKPTRNLNRFIARASRSVFHACLIAGGASLVVGFLVSLWLTSPIAALTRYARLIRDGDRPPVPRSGWAREMNQLTTALDEMRTSIEQRHDVDRTVRALAHEIKSPVSSILAASELLSEPVDQGMDEARRRRFLDSIHSEAARIHAIVEKLMALGSLERAGHLQVRQPVDLLALMHEVGESFQTHLTAKNLTLRYRFAPEAITVMGDRFLIHQAMANLLQNAVDFSPAGAEIELGFEEGSDAVLLGVRDRGPGVDPEMKDKIFDRFFSQPRPDTRRKSSGLGLNLVKEIAQLHGGSIELRPRSGGGTAAVLSLPSSARASVGTFHPAG